MKRDLPLINHIMTVAEGWSELTVLSMQELMEKLQQSEFNEASHYKVIEHLMLLSDEGLLISRIDTSSEGILFEIDRLTWKGHDFLEKFRLDQKKKLNTTYS